MCYSVHLKSNHGSDTPEGEKNVAITRAEAARQLISHKAEMEKQFAGRKISGWIIAGDMNTNHDGQFPKCTAISDLIAGGFHNTWSETPKEQRLTWRNHPGEDRFKPTTFDYLMTIGLKKNQATLIPGVPVAISDHAPVLLELSPE
jgi:endonuclease/exonuclease/phosphatase family metal-dependent hydrolase